MSDLDVTFCWADDPLCLDERILALADEIHNIRSVWPRGRKMEGWIQFGAWRGGGWSCFAVFFVDLGRIQSAGLDRSLLPTGTVNGAGAVRTEKSVNVNVRRRRRREGRKQQFFFHCGSFFFFLIKGTAIVFGVGD